LLVGVIVPLRDYYPTLLGVTQFKPLLLSAVSDGEGFETLPYETSDIPADKCVTPTKKAQQTNKVAAPLLIPLRLKESLCYRLSPPRPLRRRKATLSFKSAKPWRVPAPVAAKFMALAAGIARVLAVAIAS
jgi:hypothetical protein